MSPFDDPEMWRSILEELPTGLCVLDAHKKIVFWSSGAERVTGHLRHEIIGHSCLSEPLLHCDHPGCEFCREDCPLMCTMRTSHAVSTTGMIRHKAGHEIPVRIRAVPVRNRHGSIVGAAEIFDEFQPVASPDRGEPTRLLSDCTDPVTGLASSAMMQSHLQRSLASFSERQIPFAVLLLRMVGLPHFRASLGPEAAASLLRVIARTVESALSMTDFVGRWREDQFLAIVTGIQCGTSVRHSRATAPHSGRRRYRVVGRTEVPACFHRRNLSSGKRYTRNPIVAS